MSRTVAEMVNKLRSTGSTITSSQTLALRAMSEQAKRAIEMDARRVASDMNLSGVGTKGAPLRIRVTIGNSKAQIKAAGPWQLIEFPTKAHVIASKRYTGRRRGRGERVAAGQRRLRLEYRGLGQAGAAIRTPFGPRAYVRHPGTRGQNVWSGAVTRVLPQLPRTAQVIYRQEIAKIFR
jgi:hypothetical protein